MKRLQSCKSCTSTLSKSDVIFKLIIVFLSCIVNFHVVTKLYGALYRTKYSNFLGLLSVSIINIPATYFAPRTLPIELTVKEQCWNNEVALSLYRLGCTQGAVVIVYGQIIALITHHRNLR